MESIKRGVGVGVLAVLVVMDHTPAVAGRQQDQIDAHIAEGTVADRLLDLGLPDPDSARSIYSWLDPDTFSVKEEKLGMTKQTEKLAPPTFMLSVARPKNLLAAALDEGLSSSDCWELAFLSNKVLIANQVDVGDRSAMQDSLEEMFARLNIALEHRCGDKHGSRRHYRL